MDAMAVAIHIKYALSLKRHITFYWDPPANIIQKPNGWRIENAQGFNG